MNAGDSAALFLTVFIAIGTVLILVPGMGSAWHIGVLDRELEMAETVVGADRVAHVRTASARLIAHGLNALDSAQRTGLANSSQSPALLQRLASADGAKPAAARSLSLRWRQGAVSYAGLVFGRMLVFLPMLPWVVLIATAVVLDGVCRRKLRLLAFGGITPLYYQVAWRGLVATGILSIAIFLLPVSIHPLVPPALWIACAALLSLYLIHSARPL